MTRFIKLVLEDKDFDRLEKAKERFEETMKERGSWEVFILETIL